MQTRRPLINGKHRKQTNPIKGRVAFVAAATGVVSTAGATGAAIAHTTDTGISEISLAAEDTPNAEEGAPQILDIAEFKPVSNLQDQLNKAVQYSNDLAKADEEARKPKISVSRPTDGILTSGYGMRWGVAARGRGPGERYRHPDSGGHGRHSDRLRPRLRLRQLDSYQA